MHHNRQVAKNIATIQADVEAASTQADLIQVIRTVENHPGPLDYNDRPLRVLQWGLMAFATACLAISLLSSFFYGSAYGFLFYPVQESIFIVFNFSSYWMPPLVALFVARQLEERGLHLPLPVPAARIAAITVLGGLLALAPQWHQGYWWTLRGIALFVSGGGSQSPLVGFSVTALLVSFFLWSHLRKRRNWRQPVSERIFLLDALFNNDLKPVSTKGRMKALLSSFREFDRGNHTKELKALYRGHFRGDEHRFDYELYHFHYVRKRTVTTTDSEGNTRTRTVYDHFYRHGLLLAFPFASGVSLSADRGLKFKGERYRTASNAFNRLFDVRAEKEMAAARLLNPAVVEQLTGVGKSLKNPVLEISAGGRLCLAFDDDDLLSQKPQHDLNNPAAFAEEIAGHTELAKLKALLDAVHDVLRLSDNNFQASA